MNEKEIIYNFISGNLQYKDFLENVNERVFEYLDNIYQNKYLKNIHSLHLIIFSFVEIV